LIYANSFLSCAYTCIHGHVSQPLIINEIFTCIGRFEFDTDVSHLRPGSEVASPGKHFKITGKLPLRVLPGVKFTVPVSAKDEFENTVNSLFQVSVHNTNANSTIVVDPGTLYTSDNQIRLYGSPDSSGTLILEGIGFHRLHITLNLTLVHCPPGYVLNSIGGADPYLIYAKECEVYQFAYRFFNLDFFGITPLSFCLWQGATTLDILAFKYITITYALLLVLLTVLFMKCFNLYHTCQTQLRIYPKDKSSVIHGLSAFR